MDKRGDYSVFFQEDARLGVVAILYKGTSFRFFFLKTIFLVILACNIVMTGSNV